MNTRFAVSVHILTLLASEDGEPVSSEWIASSVNTNPALIRRLLSQLARAGLTESKMGAGGGALLARAPKDITLADVYLAVAEDAEVIPIHSSPNPKCHVGRHIQSVLEARIEAAEKALRDELDQTTVADLTRDISRRASG